MNGIKGGRICGSAKYGADFIRRELVWLPLADTDPELAFGCLGMQVAKKNARAQQKH